MARQVENHYSIFNGIAGTHYACGGSCVRSILPNNQEKSIPSFFGTQENFIDFMKKILMAIFLYPFFWHVQSALRPIHAIAYQSFLFLLILRIASSLFNHRRRICKAENGNSKISVAQTLSCYDSSELDRFSATASLFGAEKNSMPEDIFFTALFNADAPCRRVSS
jgi:hypothetical protein